MMLRFTSALVILGLLAGCATSLYTSAYNGFTHEIESYVRGGGNVNARLPDDHGNLGRTALGWAAYGGKCETVAKLLALGADPNVTDNDKETPAHNAAYAYIAQFPSYKIGEEQYACILGKLRQHGADLTLKNKGGETPLHLAAYHGHVELVRNLVEAQRVPVDIRGWRGATPLYMAAWNGHPQTIKALFALGANPHAGTDFGETWADIWDKKGKKKLEERIAVAKGSGFQWGKLAALAAGAGIGGFGNLSPAQQTQLLTAMIADSMPGQDGATNLQSAANEAARRNQGGATKTAGAQPQKLPLKHHTLSHTCPSGAKLDTQVPYRTEACLNAAIEFAKVYACNEARAFDRVRQNCQHACGSQTCSE